MKVQINQKKGGQIKADYIKQATEEKILRDERIKVLEEEINGKQEKRSHLHGM
jgi:hypothetical protein